VDLLAKIDYSAQVSAPLGHSLV